MANRVQYQVDMSDHEDYARSQQRPAESDPLRELARLIGQTDPNSQFARAQQHQEPAFAGHEAGHYYDEPQQHADNGPAWTRAAQAGRAQQPPIGGRATPLPQPSYDEPAYQQPAAYDTETPPPLSQPPAFLRARQQREPVAPQFQQPDPRYDDALYGQNPENVQYQDQYQQGHQDQYAPYDPNAYQQYDETPAPRRKRGGLFTVGVVMALAFVGTASAYGYRTFMGSSRSGEPPVIKAEQGANKIVPQQSADAAGKINDRIGAINGPERVVPREEQPVDINARQQPRVVFPPLNQNNNPPSVQSVSTTTAIVGQPAPQQANGAVGDEPRRVRTTTIRPPEGTPRPAAAQPTAARAQIPAANAPMSLSPQAAAPTRTAAVATTTGSTGGYVVQITSQRSEAEAKSAYQSLQSKYGSVLGSRPALIRRADLGDKGIYYRAMVGPFSGADDASQLCSNLKSAGGSCVVQRN